ncbi:hypothetical protein, partial [Escherichia coli]|uniref:hypothetical protein n=1 Tax=Escherichia coli TaxID=562 RepID=UPI001BAF5D66
RRPLLPRPSGNVSAILTPPTPELFLFSGQKVSFDNRCLPTFLDNFAYQFYFDFFFSLLRSVLYVGFCIYDGAGVTL